MKSLRGFRVAPYSLASRNKQTHGRGVVMRNVKPNLVHKPFETTAHTSRGCHSRPGGSERPKSKDVEATLYPGEPMRFKAVSSDLQGSLRWEHVL